MKKIVMIIGVVVVALALAVVIKNAVIKIAVEKGVEAVTGLKLSIGSLDVGILKQVVAIRSLRLENPAGYPDRAMITIPEIYVDYDLPAILGGTVHLKEARFDLSEFVVEKNARGELNLNALRTIAARKTAAPAKKAEVASTEKAAMPKIRIDRLAIRIGKVVYKDYSTGAVPVVREFPINISELYTDVDNPVTLANLIVVKALMNTTIAGLAGFDLRGLQGSVGTTLAGAQKIAASAFTDMDGTLATSQQAVAASVKTATETAKQAQGSAKQAAAAVQDLLKNPFASKE